MPPTTDAHDKAIDAHSHTALTTTKRNLRYLYSPSTAPSHPTSRRTRAIVSTRFISPSAR